MGRFFQTTPTQFTEDFIYQPPWELIQQAAAKKQQQYDNALATSKLFGDIPIQHLQGVDDIANVKEKQRYYAESADMIAKAIQNDPSKVNQYMSSLEALGKELSVDMKQGDLSKIQNSAIGFKAWQDDEGNKEMKKTDPARYAAAEKTFLSRYVNAGGNSISQGFKGEQITKDVDWKEILANADKMKASEYDVTQDRASGLNIYTSKSSGKVVKKEDIEKDIMGRLITDPSNLAALRQSQDFGMAKYFDDETGALDYSASGFNGIRGIAEANAYSTQTNSNSISGNTGAIAANSEANQNMRQEKGFAHTKAMKALDYEYEVLKEENKTKKEQLSAVDIKIAEAVINDDEKSRQVWTNHKNNLTGTAGIYQSNLGSVFGSVSNLQKEAAQGNVEAQKIVNANLPKLLGEAGINYKDPIQKAVAEKAVGLFKQNKLKIEDIPDFIKKEIPVSRSSLTTQELAKASKQANSDIYQATYSIKNNISNIKDRIKEEERIAKDKQEQFGKKMLMGKVVKYGDPVAQMQEKRKAEARINTLTNQLKQEEKKLQSVDVKGIQKKAQDRIYNSKKNENQGVTDNLITSVKGGIKGFEEKWKTLSQFPSTNETASLSIATQSTLKGIFQDPEVTKEWFIENQGKNEVLTADQVKNLNFVSATEMDGKTRNGVIAIDKNGKQYKITADRNSPAYKVVMNAVKYDVNPNSLLGQSILYPSAGILLSKIEAGKTKGISNQNISIKANNKEYKVIQVGSSDRYNVYDGVTLLTKQGPVNYLQAGVAIDDQKK